MDDDDGDDIITNMDDINSLLCNESLASSEDGIDLKNVDITASNTTTTTIIENTPDTITNLLKIQKASSKGDVFQHVLNIKRVFSKHMKVCCTYFYYDDRYGKFCTDCMINDGVGDYNDYSDELDAYEFVRHVTNEYRFIEGAYCRNCNARLHQIIPIECCTVCNRE